MTTHQAKVYECDNPSCRKMVPEREPGFEAAPGFHFGGIVHVHEGGGDTFAEDTFACSYTCLLPALEAARAGYDRRGE